MRTVKILILLSALILKFNSFGSTFITIRDTGYTTTLKQIELSAYDSSNYTLFDCGYSNNSENIYVINNSTVLNIQRSTYFGYNLDTVCIIHSDSQFSVIDTIQFIVSNAYTGSIFRDTGLINTTSVICTPRISGLQNQVSSLLFCGHQNNSGISITNNFNGCKGINRSNTLGYNLDTMCIIYIDTVNLLSCADTIIFSNIRNYVPCDFSFSNFDISVQVNLVTISQLNTNGRGYEFILDNSATSIGNNAYSYNSSGLKEICLHVFDSTDQHSPCDTFICKTVDIQIDSCPAIIHSISNVTFQRNDTFSVQLNFSAEGYDTYLIDYGDGSLPQTDLFHIYPDDGDRTICLTVNNSNFSGCTQTSCINISFQSNTCDSITCVLPGDADHDLTVNNFDVFAIGLSYGRLGSRRPNATNAYILQPSPDWQSTHYYGYNDKFADCNGDSIINAQDAIVIYNNYIAQVANTFNHRIGQLDSMPQVSLSFDTLPIIVANGTCAGAQISGDIHINSTNQIENTYGIAFSVEYPVEFYDSCFSVTVDLDNTSWLVNNEPVILFYKNIPEFHRVDVSVVRTNGIGSSGNGRIGKIKFITEGDIFGKQLKMASPFIYTFNVNMTEAIDNKGDKINLYGSSSTVTFLSLSTRKNEIRNLLIFPNPVNTQLQIQAEEQITDITISDIAGKTVFSDKPGKFQNVVDCSQLPSGIYFMQIKSDQGMSVVKFVRQ